MLFFPAPLSLSPAGLYRYRKAPAGRLLPSRRALLYLFRGAAYHSSGFTRAICSSSSCFWVTSEGAPSSPQAPHPSLPRRAGKLARSAAAPLPTRPGVLWGPRDDGRPSHPEAGGGGRKKRVIPPALPGRYAARRAASG